MVGTRLASDSFFMGDSDINDTTSNAPFQPINSTPPTKNNPSPGKDATPPETPKTSALDVRIWDATERMELIKTYSSASSGKPQDERLRKNLLSQSKKLEEIVNNNTSLNTARGYNEAMYPFLVAIAEQGADLGQIKKILLDDLPLGSFQRLAYPVLMKRLEKDHSNRGGIRHLIGCFKDDELKKFRLFCDANKSIHGLQDRLDKKELSPRAKA